MQSQSHYCTKFYFQHNGGKKKTENKCCHWGVLQTSTQSITHAHWTQVKHGPHHGYYSSCAYAQEHMLHLFQAYFHPQYWTPESRLANGAVLTELEWCRWSLVGACLGLRLPTLRRRVRGSEISLTPKWSPRNPRTNCKLWAFDLGENQFLGE